MKPIIKATTLALFLFILIPSAFSIGISPASKIIDAIPNTETEIVFTAINPGTSSDLKFTISMKDPGPVSKYIELPANTDDLIIPAGGGKEFKVKIKFPDTITDDVRPGNIDVFIGVSEDLSGKQGAPIMVMVNQFALIRIRVPYPGLYIDAALRSKDVESGQKVPIELEITSRGRQTINSLSVDAAIYSEGNKILSLEPKQFSNIKTLEIAKSAWSIDSSSLPVGDYKVVANINYDGQKQDAETTFRIGTEDLKIEKFTEELQTGAIRKFDVDVKSVWNNQIKDIWAEIKITKGSIVVDSQKSAVVEKIDPFAGTTLTSYIDTTEIEPGDYKSDITVHFSGKQKKASGELKISIGSDLESPGKPNNYVGIYLVIAVFVLILVGVNVYLLLKKKNEKK